MIVSWLQFNLVKNKILAKNRVSKKLANSIFWVWLIQLGLVYLGSIESKRLFVSHVSLGLDSDRDESS